MVALSSFRLAYNVPALAAGGELEPQNRQA